MVGGPNGTTRSEEIILSFGAHGVYKVVRVSGKKNTWNASAAVFRVTVPATGYHSSV